MKKLLILFFLFTIFSSLSATENAFDKGAFRIGGNTYIQRVTGDAYSSVTILRFAPATSYAIKKSLFIGINGLLEKSKRSGRSGSTIWAVGPIVEFYFQKEKIEKAIIPYVRLLISIGESQTTEIQQVGINVGFLKMINKNIGFDFGVSYSFDKIRYKGRIYDPETNRVYFDNSKKDGNLLLIGIGLESFIF